MGDELNLIKSFWKKNLELEANNFDMSKLYFEYLEEYSADPISLLYLGNFLSQRYVLLRTIYLLNSSVGNYENQKYLPPLDEFHNFFGSELYIKNICKNKINLQSSSILPWVWSRSRIENCLNDIGIESNPWKKDPNHRVMFLFPMCWTLVYGGNHSITTGILKSAIVDFEIDEYYDLSSIYKVAYYKKDKLYINNKKTILHPNEIVIGILFEIGKAILNTGFSYKDYVCEYQEKYDPLRSKFSNEFKVLASDKVTFIEKFVMNKKPY